ncbi:MAG: signal recognition particle-docking protein FtsY [Bacteroidales bacterium]|nr:signal recognition particle-docking protein FtsY [Bacteroidales bacterium]
MSEKTLNKGLEKTKKGLFSRLSRAVIGRSRVDDKVLDDLEEALIASDVGVDTTLRIIERLEDRVQRDKYMNTEELNKYLREEIEALLLENKETNDIIPFDFSKKPFVVLVVGVNGTGKTTTVGKLAAQLKKEGKQVLLGAADTFRAAAIDQLTVWSERAGVPIVKQAMGSDPAAVAYDSLASALSRDMDVLLIDTAGRLHNKIHLMNELSKIKRVLQKQIPDAPHEVLLVLDGSTGQNAYQQAREFSKATDVTALAVTKLDGTAKGGVVIGISDMLQVPVKFIGLGEGIDDLQVFDKKSFVATLFD